MKQFSVFLGLALLLLVTPIRAACCDNRYVVPMLSEWMGLVSGAKTVGELSIPATHNSATWATRSLLRRAIQCQNYNFDDQLMAGVRAFDLRLDDDMVFYHANFRLRTNFDEYLRATIKFLAANPSEFVIALVKSENTASNSTRWEGNFFRSIDKYPRSHYVFDRDFLCRTVDELRGKIVFVTREADSTKSGYVSGAPFVTWQDNTSATPTSSSNGAMPIYLEDHYKSPTLERVKLSLDALERATQDVGDNWYVTFISGFNVKGVMPNPRKFAKNTMPAIWQGLLCGQGGIDCDKKLGTVMIDFVDTEHGRLIINDMIRRNLGK